MFSLSILRSLGAFALFATLTACSEPRSAADDASTTCTPQDQSTTPADLSPATPKCAAAKGLPGDNVLCVDFDKISQLTDPALAGWNFNTSVSGGCMGWVITGGKLQLNNYPSLSGNCGITLPSFDFKSSTYQKYQSASLSIIHTIEIGKPQQQQALVYLVSDNDDQQIWSTIGKNARQQTTLTVAKSDIPPLASSVFQPILKFVAPGSAGSLQGWKIESIAINLSP